VCSYGAADLSLGGLAALLGRDADAVGHLQDAVRLNDAFGCVIWRTRAERELTRIAQPMLDRRPSRVPPGGRTRASLGEDSPAGDSGGRL
jgi:hypothetical protein